MNLCLVNDGFVIWCFTETFLTLLRRLKTNLNPSFAKNKSMHIWIIFILGMTLKKEFRKDLSGNVRKLLLWNDVNILACSFSEIC